MKIFSNTLNKLISNNPKSVEYSLQNGSSELSINPFIGKTLTFRFTGRINCIYCSREIDKSYGQGFCFACNQTLPQAAPSVIRPELDLSHKGISRNMEWAKKNSLVDHFVYLAISSSLKVGITRHTQIPTRWIDQGAIQAIKIAKVPYRQLSGLIEVELKDYFSDKTNWRNMLTNKIDEGINLIEERNKAHKILKKKFAEFLIDDDVTSINYPVLDYPNKVTGINLDKTHEFQSKLIGIKGQYMIFDDNRVLNIRKHSGYFVEIEAKR
jgi:hypothetical protein